MCECGCKNALRKSSEELKHPLVQYTYFYTPLNFGLRLNYSCQHSRVTFFCASIIVNETRTDETCRSSALPHIALSVKQKVTWLSQPVKIFWSELSLRLRYGMNFAAKPRGRAVPRA